MKHLKTYFGHKEIALIKRRDVEQYVGQRKAAGAMPGTLNRELSCLKNMLRKGIDWEYLEVNPAWGVKQQREEVPEFEILYEEEAIHLIEVCSP
jgi:site-specific recombinase XerD